MAEPCIAVDPVVRSLPVQSPVRFVGVDGVIAAAELLGNVVHYWLVSSGQKVTQNSGRSLAGLELGDSGLAGVIACGVFRPLSVQVGWLPANNRRAQRVP